MSRGGGGEFITKYWRILDLVEGGTDFRADNPWGPGYIENFDVYDGASSWGDEYLILNTPLLVDPASSEFAWQTGGWAGSKGAEWTAPLGRYYPDEGAGGDNLDNDNFHGEGAEFDLFYHRLTVGAPASELYLYIEDQLDYWDNVEQERATGMNTLHKVLLGDLDGDGYINDTEPAIRAYEATLAGFLSSCEVYDVETSLATLRQKFANRLAAYQWGSARAVVEDEIASLCESHAQYLEGVMGLTQAEFESINARLRQPTWQDFSATDPAESEYDLWNNYRQFIIQKGDNWLEAGAVKQYIIVQQPERVFQAFMTPIDMGGEKLHLTRVEGTTPGPLCYSVVDGVVYVNPGSKTGGFAIDFAWKAQEKSGFNWDDYLVLDTTGEAEWTSLLTEFYAKGFRAPLLGPTYIADFSPFDIPGFIEGWFAITARDMQDTLETNLQGYAYSENKILVPKAWVLSKQDLIDQVRLYREYPSTLLDDLTEFPVGCDVSITPHWDGLLTLEHGETVESGLNFDVTYDYWSEGISVEADFIVPEGFSLSHDFPSTPREIYDFFATFTPPFSRDYHFTLSADDPALVAGIYYLILEIQTVDDEAIVYREAYPFRYNWAANALEVTFGSQPSAGANFTLFELWNDGNYPQGAYAEISGLPWYFLESYQDTRVHVGQSVEEDLWGTSAWEVGDDPHSLVTLDDVLAFDQSFMNGMYPGTCTYDYYNHGLYYNGDFAGHPEELPHFLDHSRVLTIPISESDPPSGLDANTQAIFDLGTSLERGTVDLWVNPGDIGSGDEVVYEFLDEDLHPGQGFTLSEDGIHPLSGSHTVEYAGTNTFADFTLGDFNGMAGAGGWVFES